MPITEQRIRAISQEEIAKSSSVGRYTLNTTAGHQHTGIDTPRVGYSDLLNKQVIATSVIPGTSAATAGNYGPFFIAPAAMSIQEMQVSYVTNSTSGLLYVEILKPGQASGAGTAVQAFSMSSSALNNQVGTSTLRTGSKAVILNPNDRLSLFMSGTATGQTQVTVTVVLQINN